MNNEDLSLIRLRHAYEVAAQRRMAAEPWIFYASALGGMVVGQNAHWSVGVAVFVLTFYVALNRYADIQSKAQKAFHSAAGIGAYRKTPSTTET